MAVYANTDISALSGEKYLGLKSSDNIIASFVSLASATSLSDGLGQNMAQKWSNCRNINPFFSR